MGSRRHSREYALQMLFQRDLGGSGSAPAEVNQTFWEGKEESEEVKKFAESLAIGTVTQIVRIDDMIRRQAQHWRLDRMAAVDRNILRLAVYELLEGATPPAVIINEAIEIARKFSTDESTQFVNGILDGIRKELSQEVGS
ncbi:MAG: transcription antitermination factor NusB [Acidobacteria bacterium]|nr:transcription antitermination factor NusB [Acidobacteriota bacterium]